MDNKLGRIVVWLDLISVESLSIGSFAVLSSYHSSVNVANKEWTDP